MGLDKLWNKVKAVFTSKKPVPQEPIIVEYKNQDRAISGTSQSKKQSQSKSAVVTRDSRKSSIVRTIIEAGPRDRGSSPANIPTASKT